MVHDKLTEKGQVNSNTIVVHQQLLFSIKTNCCLFYTEFISSKDGVTDVFKKELLEQIASLKILQK